MVAEIAQNDIATKEGSSKPKVSLSFELNRSHIFKLNKASVSIEELVLEEIIPEKKQEEPEEKQEEEKPA